MALILYCLFYSMASMFLNLVWCGASTCGNSVIVIWIALAFPCSPNYSGISLTWGLAFVDASQILIFYSWMSCCIFNTFFSVWLLVLKFFVVLSQAQRLSSACVLFANEPIKGILVCPDICDLWPFFFDYFLEFLSFCLC